MCVCLQVFMLPKVSAKTKFKLTAHEGCRVRKVGLANYASTASDDYSENGLVCLTNLGDIHVFSVPALRPQVRYDCIRKEDISGIASCVFTKTGQGEDTCSVVTITTSVSFTTLLTGTHTSVFEP